MRLNILNANKWRFPKVKFMNWRKESPKASKTCWSSWFSFDRFWYGKLWYINIKHYGVVLDFRYSPWDDMAFPETTKADRKAIRQLEEKEAVE